MSKELFKALKNSKIGDQLVAYCESLENEVYDSRNWQPGMTKETADLAAFPIRKLINNVKMQGEDVKDVGITSFE